MAYADDFAEEMRRRQLQRMMFPQIGPDPSEQETANPLGDVYAQTAPKIAPNPRHPGELSLVDPSHPKGQELLQQSSKQDEYMKRLGEYPKLEDEPKPSTGRKILGTIAGVASGILAPNRRLGPIDTAIQTAHRVEYPGYGKKLGAYQRDTGILGEQAELEQKQQESAAKIGHLKAQGEAEVSRKSAEEARAQTQAAQRRVLPPDYETKLKGDIEVAKAKKTNPSEKMSTASYVITLQDGKKVVGASKDEKTGQYVDPISGTRINQGAIKDITEVGKESTNQGTEIDKVIRDENQARKDKGQPEMTAQERGQRRTQLMTSPEANVLRSLQAGLTAQNLTNLKEETSPETLNSYLTQMEQNPDLYHEIVARDPKIAPTLGRAWQERTGKTIPMKLDPATTKQERLARTAQNHAAVIKEYISDPKVLEYLGTFMGKGQKLDQFLGSNLEGAPPGTEKKLADLQYRLKVLQGQEVQASLGSGRPAQKMFEEFSRVTPRIDVTLPKLQGAIDGVIGSADVIRKTIDEQRFGSTSSNNNNSGQKRATHRYNPQTGQIEEIK